MAGMAEVTAELWGPESIMENEKAEKVKGRVFGRCPLRPLLAAAVLAVVVSGSVLAAEERQNWHNDPFFQIASGVDDCPLPRGPYMTRTQQLAEAHHRAERGTTCWLVGKCERPTSYHYDQDIATAFRKTLAEQNPFAAATLWVTVQGRVVYIEGCGSEAGLARRLESFAMGLPYVEMAVAKIRSEPLAPPPYPVGR